MEGNTYAQYRKVIEGSPDVSDRAGISANSSTLTK